METFVVRVWRPAHGATPEPELKGTILHPATGQERPFTNESELLEILRDLPASP